MSRLSLHQSKRKEKTNYIPKAPLTTKPSSSLHKRKPLPCYYHFHPTELHLTKLNLYFQTLNITELLKSRPIKIFKSNNSKITQTVKKNLHLRGGEE